MEHCCDPCIKESTCFSEEQCCDPCDPRSYCFDFYADCDIHYGTQTTNLDVTSVTVANATKVETTVANATTVEATAVEVLEATPVETAHYYDDDYYDDNYYDDDHYDDDQYDDDYYDDDDYYYHVDERPLYSISLDAFSPARLGGRSEGIGEIYPFGGRATSAADTTDTTIHVNVDGTGYALYVVHEGYCTRTSTTGSVRGFCHWQYTVEGVGTFVASGGLGDPSKPSTLAIEGGTGILIGATGSVTIYGATVNDASFPNVAATIVDPFAGVDGYLHAVKIYADDAFSNGSTNGVFKTMAPTMAPTTSPGNSTSVVP